MKSQKDQPSFEDAVRACYSTWGEGYYDEYYASEAAYPPVHTEIIRRLLNGHGAHKVLDAGCGPASMLRDLNELGATRYGFDLTPEMVDVAREILADQGVPANQIWEGSVLDPDAFRSLPGEVAGYDAVICIGVLPHVPEAADSKVLTNLCRAVRPGGLVAVEARNQLFALFTLNRYSRTFFRETLIDESGLRKRAGKDAESLEAALEELDDRFRLEFPPIRKGNEREPGYDEVLSRTHNPFELKSLAEKAGMNDIRIHFYHFHALPPMLESRVPELFRRESLRMENPDDWRGYFMASAFILSGSRAPD